MHAAIADHKSEIAELCRGYGVRRLEIFGSAARATDFDPENSDADFLVEFYATPEHLTPLGQYFGFSDALKALLGRPVDLIAGREIKNPYLRDSINADRELIYAS
jgi:hypothetical protein